MQLLTEKKHKELIKASLLEIMTENKEFFKEIFSEIIEDAGMVNAIQEGRINKFVDEKNIMAILEG
jgi:Asp-tRNA(Asn)/Glu-tRNA(Gln) amidotransferase C subunit